MVTLLKKKQWRKRWGGKKTFTPSRSHNENQYDKKAPLQTYSPKYIASVTYLKEATSLGDYGLLGWHKLRLLNKVTY
jgi:hypothetical protein